MIERVRNLVAGSRKWASIRDWRWQADRPYRLIAFALLPLVLVAILERLLMANDMSWFRDWVKESPTYGRLFFPAGEGIEWKDRLQGILLLLGLPVAFCLWYWPDRNVRDQIENVRKDINLKEFQELQLRAAGAISTDIPEKSRQTLWISALHQMRGFLRGEYGATFRRPALEVYCALMERQKRSEKIDDPNEANPEPDMGLPDSVYRTVRSIIFEEWKSFFWDDFSRGIGWPLQGRSLRRIRLPIGAILDKLDFSRTDFSQSDFGSVSLSGAKLWDANFQGCNLRCAVLTEVEGDGISLDHADLAGVAAQHADFSNASINGTTFHGAELSGASFFKVKGSNCAFVSTKLEAANFNGANFSGVNFQNARLKGAKFVSAYITANQIDGADLSGCDFSFAHLGGFHPTRAKSCKGAILNGKTVLPHLSGKQDGRLLSTERAAILALWQKHGASVVEPIDTVDEIGDDAIMSQRSLIEAMKRTVRGADGTTSL